MMRALVLVLCVWVELSECSDPKGLLTDDEDASPTVALDPQHAPSHHQRAAVEENVPVIYFPKANRTLKRRKRDWEIPPIHVPERYNGPFPKKISKVASSEDRNKRIYYSITGPGADQEPANRFFMDRETGVLYVTEPLDREERSSYTFLVHAVAEGSGSAEAPVEVLVIVIDMNDNIPVFTQDMYIGQVSESSPLNFEILQVKATDADEEGTSNAAVRYRIMNQEPKSPSDKMFIINPFSGTIHLNATGLSKEKTPQYSLEVQAADMEGEGLTDFTRVILTVTDGNDHAPLYTQTQGLDFEKTSEDPTTFLTLALATGSSEDTSPTLGPTVKPDPTVRQEVAAPSTRDPDSGHRPTLGITVASDAARRLNEDNDAGLVTVKSEMNSTATGAYARDLLKPVVSVSEASPRAQGGVWVMMGADFRVRCSMEPPFPGGSIQLLSPTASLTLPADDHAADFLFTEAGPAHRGEYTCVYLLQVFNHSFSSNSSLHIRPGESDSQFLVRALVLLLLQLLNFIPYIFYRRQATRGRQSGQRARRRRADREERTDVVFDQI